MKFFEKQQLIRVFLFVLVFAVLFGVLEVVGRLMYPMATNLKSQAQALKSAAPETEVLAMGNSHIGAAVNCRYIKAKCFNGSIGSQDLYYTYNILRTNIDRFRHLKVLLLGISHFGFGLDTEDISVYLARDYFLYFGIWPKSGGLVRLAVGSSAVLTHRDVYWRDLYAKISNHPKENTTGLGANGEPISEGRAAVARYFAAGQSQVHGRIISDNVVALQNLVALAESKGISLVLVTTPTTSYYFEAFSKSVRKEFYTTTEGILQGHPSVKFLDFTSWSKITDEDFEEDGHHLNPAGTEIFSNSLNAWLEQNYHLESTPN